MGDRVNVTEERFNINIMRLHSRSYIVTLRSRNTTILELKEEIAAVSGVASGLQHLLFRGRALRDDHVLSDYQIERDHTLYLVVRPPIPRLIQSENAAADFNLSGMGSQRRQRVEFPDALTRVSSFLRRHDANSLQIAPYIRETLVETRRHLLIGEVAQTLANISAQLANQSGQRLQHRRANEAEFFLINLGSSLIELGRTISRLHRGEEAEVSTTHGILEQGNEVIRRKTTYTFSWPLPQIQPPLGLASSESQNAEEEVEDSDSD